MFEKLKEKYKSLTPKQKKRTHLFFVLGSVMLLVWIVSVRGEEETKEVRKAKKPDAVFDIDTKVLSKKFNEDAQAAMRKQHELFEAVSTELAGLRKAFDSQMREMNDIRAEMATQNKKPLDAKDPSELRDDDLAVPVSHLPPGLNPYGEADKNASDMLLETPEQEVPTEVVGNIQLVSLSGSSPEVKKKESAKKGQVIDTLYLSPAFMEGVLMNGLSCPVAKEATASPVPTLVRVSSSAILPSRYKADVRDCFLVSGCVGNLSTESADCRLVSLSCLSRSGQAVIDQPVKGYLVDQSSGFIGLRGQVVARLGSLLARSMVAGLFGGAGEYLESSTMTSMVSPLGETIGVPNFDPQSLAQGAIGKGIAQATKELQSFYMRLVDATLPTIQVGVGKKCTAVISEGVELQILEYKLNVQDDCIDCQDGGIFY